MHELLQALDIAVVEELFLEIRPGRLGGGALWRCHSPIPRRRYLHSSVVQWCILCPARIGLAQDTKPLSEARSQSQIAEAEAEGLAVKPRTLAWSDKRKHPWD